ncbi:hypothetical protein [Brochothrix thermosphacta]|uniref:hypothetical protein n=1 Tax=Brochothrix thermosphacta TaxID=2756 RepID=UPI00083F5FA3|nr:hypothetical protein [Brochothrix thermosphacta]ODJ63257.1 hypothetical protein BFR35_01365 [Brochothrix thermosphacta]
MKGVAVFTFKDMSQITLDIEDTEGCLFALGGLTMIVVNETRSISYNTSDIAQVEINDCGEDE